MLNWLKKTFLADFIGVYRSVRSMRKDGARGELMIMQMADYQGIIAEEKRWTAIREAEKELAIRCIEHMIHGGKACIYCEDWKDCNTSKQAANKRGCDKWWLRYLTEEEQKGRAKRTEGRGQPKAPQPRSPRPCRAGRGPQPK